MTCINFVQVQHSLWWSISLKQIKIILMYASKHLFLIFFINFFLEAVCSCLSRQTEVTSLSQPKMHNLRLRLSYGNKMYLWGAKLKQYTYVLSNSLMVCRSHIYNMNILGFYCFLFLKSLTDCCLKGQILTIVKETALTTSMVGRETLFFFFLNKWLCA